MQLIVVTVFLCALFHIKGSLSHGDREQSAEAIQNALQTHARPWIPQDVKVSVNVDVEFYPSALEYTACCKTIKLQEREVKLDPTGDARVQPAETRTDATIKVEFKMFPNITGTFDGKQYTLLSFDPDVPSVGAGTIERPLVHWLVTNIPGDKVENGKTINSYRGPGPPNPEPHFYYFLLYEQQGTLAFNDSTEYAGDACSDRLLGRCLFDVQKFRTDNNLKLVGATWMIARHDMYVRYQHILRGTPEAEVCDKVEGYSDPCPISSAATFTVSSLLFLMVVGAIVFK